MAAMMILFWLYRFLLLRLDYGIKCTCCALPIYFCICTKIGPQLREMVLAPFSKRNAFNKSRKDGKCGIDLVDYMLNTLQTLELANGSLLFTSIWKHYHTQWSTNIIQLFMNEFIMKHVILGLECVKQGINQSLPNFTSFLKLLKEFQFLKGTSIISYNVKPILSLKCLTILVKPQHVHFMP